MAGGGSVASAVSAPGKVVVAMSGGVDSSVAAALLVEAGHDVVGCFMRNGAEPAQTCSSGGRKQGCCSVNDADDARRVAAMLGVPFYVLNFASEFGRVMDYFQAEYDAGRTPNPCVRCNDWLKFGKLHEYAAAVGASHVASGHYARIGTDPATGRPALLRGVDAGKDQSYVLFGHDAAGLSRTLLPVGGFAKGEIRSMAEARGLPVFDKPDSQEICFVPDQDYAGFLERRGSTIAPGELVSTDGDGLGEHRGHQHYTVGQRRGLGLALGHPIYVTHIEPATNRVTVGGKADLLAGGLVASKLNLLAERNWTSLRCQAQIRYNGRPVPAVASVDGDRLTVTFDEPQSAVSPGQAVVLYDGELVLGGGWIDAALG